MDHRNIQFFFFIIACAPLPFWPLAYAKKCAIESATTIRRDEFEAIGLRGCVSKYVVVFVVRIVYARLHFHFSFISRTSTFSVMACEM